MQKRSQDNDDDQSHHQIGYKRRQQDALDDQLWKGVCHQVASRGNSMPLHRSTMLLVRTRHAATSASIVSLCRTCSRTLCAMVRSVAASRLTIAARASSASGASGPSMNCINFASQCLSIDDWSKQESIFAKARLSCAPPAARNCSIREASRNVASSGGSPFGWTRSCNSLRASASSHILRLSSETGGISICAASRSVAAAAMNRQVKRKACGL